MGQFESEVRLLGARIDSRQRVITVMPHAAHNALFAINNSHSKMLGRFLLAQLVQMKEPGAIRTWLTESAATSATVRCDRGLSNRAMPTAMAYIIKPSARVACTQVRITNSLNRPRNTRLVLHERKGQCYAAMSSNPTISSTLQTRSETPASIAGVTRSVW